MTGHGVTRKWNGLCPASKHGLDFKGQACDLCSRLEGYMLLEWSTPRLRASQLLPLDYVETMMDRFAFDAHLEAFTFFIPAGASFAEAQQYVEAYLGAL